jgi:diamine N-acetyltransferase
VTAIQSKVTLRKITKDNVRSICELAVKKEQSTYVVPNAIAIAEACFSNEDWYRAIYADEIPVGLAVLKVQPDNARYLLWRFMIDARYQKSDFGRRAMELLIDHVKTKPNAVEFLTSVVPGDHCPQGFYEKLGFHLTGEWDDGEAIMSLGFGEK